MKLQPMPSYILPPAGTKIVGFQGCVNKQAELLGPSQQPHFLCRINFSIIEECGISLPTARRVFKLDRLICAP